MKKTFTFIATLLIIAVFNITTAQDVNDPKHENHFKKVDNIETDQYKIEISDAHAQQAFCQMKLKVTNKTNDYLFINPEEFVFTLEQGAYSPKPKGGISSLISGDLIIAPNKSKSFVAKVANETNFHVEEFKLEIKGFYQLSTDVKGLETEKFQLPANKNKFETGEFIVYLTDIKQATQETVAKFTCTYQGDKVGIIDASKLGVTTEKGDYANSYRKSKEVLMQKGDKEKFVAKFEIEGRILDMQFATMHIDWKDTFKESEKVALKGHKLNFVIDPGLTAGKNK